MSSSAHWELTLVREPQPNIKTSWKENVQQHGQGLPGEKKKGPKRLFTGRLALYVKQLPLSSLQDMCRNTWCLCCSCFWIQRWWKPAPCWYLMSMTSWRTRRTAKARATLHERWEHVTDLIVLTRSCYLQWLLFFVFVCRWTRLWTLCVAPWGTCRMLWNRFPTASLKEWPKCQTTWGACPRDSARTSDSLYSRQVLHSVSWLLSTIFWTCPFYENTPACSTDTK